jgi:hypothetical protein
MEVVMALTYRVLLVLHILAAGAAVVAFWAAAAARKGSARHVLVGKAFVGTMTVMCVSALMMSAFNLTMPEVVHSLDEFRGRGAIVGENRTGATVQHLAREFRLNAVWLTYAAMLLLTALRFGTGVVRTRSTRASVLKVDTALAGLLVITGVVLTVFGGRVGHPLILTFGLMGAYAGARRLFILVRPPRSRMAWWYEHMGTLLGTGIPLHVTMLLAIGRHLPGPPGSWRVTLSGIAILGLPAITMWIRYYRKRFEPRTPRTHGTTTSGPAATQPA